MTLTPAIISSAILASSTISGPQWPLVCSGIGIGVSEWLYAGGVTLAGVAAGGFGPVLGTRVILPPQPALMVQGLAGAGLVGPKATEIGVAVAVGLSVAVSSAGTYVGVAAGAPLGSPGVDVSKVVSANVPMLTGMLTSGLAGATLIGASAGELAIGLSVGIGMMMLTGTGTGVVPAPGTGGPSVSLLQ